MAKEFKVLCGVVRPDKQDGTPIYTFHRSSDDTQNLQYVLNQFVDEGCQVVSLAFPRSYSAPQGGHYSPATIVFSREKERR